MPFPGTAGQFFFDVEVGLSTPGFLRSGTAIVFFLVPLGLEPSRHVHGAQERVLVDGLAGARCILLVPSIPWSGLVDTDMSGFGVGM